MERPTVELSVCTGNQSMGAGQMLLCIWRLYLCALLLAFTFHLLEVIECMYDTLTWDTIWVKFGEITTSAATPNLDDWVGAAVRPGLLRRAGALCTIACLTKAGHLGLAHRRAGRAVEAPAGCAGASREARPRCSCCARARHRLCGPPAPSHQPRDSPERVTGETWGLRAGERESTEAFCQSGVRDDDMLGQTHNSPDLGGEPRDASRCEAYERRVTPARLLGGGFVRNDFDAHLTMSDLVALAPTERECAGPCAGYLPPPLGSAAWLRLPICERVFCPDCSGTLHCTYPGIPYHCGTCGPVDAPWQPDLRVPSDWGVMTGRHPIRPAPVIPGGRGPCSRCRGGHADRAVQDVDGQVRLMCSLCFRRSSDAVLPQPDPEYDSDEPRSGPRRGSVRTRRGRLRVLYFLCLLQVSAGLPLRRFFAGDWWDNPAPEGAGPNASVNASNSSNLTNSEELNSGAGYWFSPGLFLSWGGWVISGGQGWLLTWEAFGLSTWLSNGESVGLVWEQGGWAGAAVDWAGSAMFGFLWPRVAFWTMVVSGIVSSCCWRRRSRSCARPAERCTGGSRGAVPSGYHALKPALDTTSRPCRSGLVGSGGAGQGWAAFRQTITFGTRSAGRAGSTRGASTMCSSA